MDKSFETNDNNLEWYCKGKQIKNENIKKENNEKKEEEDDDLIPYFAKNYQPSSESENNIEPISEEVNKEIEQDSDYEVDVNKMSKSEENEEEKIENLDEEIENEKKEEKKDNHNISSKKKVKNSKKLIKGGGIYNNKDSGSDNKSKESKSLKQEDINKFFEKSKKKKIEKPKEYVKKYPRNDYSVPDTPKKSENLKRLRYINVEDEDDINISIYGDDITPKKEKYKKKYETNLRKPYESLNKQYGERNIPTIEYLKAMDKYYRFMNMINNENYELEYDKVEIGNEYYKLIILKPKTYRRKIKNLSKLLEIKILKGEEDTIIKVNKKLYRNLKINSIIKIEKDENYSIFNYSVNNFILSLKYNY